jgi:transposase
MEDSKKISRRRYDAEFKAQVLAECARPEASVAAVALAHGINANVVHKWRRLDGGVQPAGIAPTFVPVPLPAPVCDQIADIRVELHRGPLHVTVSWPLAGAGQCAAWMRELLR